jgi:hypothetical protein
MFTLNKESRSFIFKNFTSVRREFFNNGLIDYSLTSGGSHALDNVIKLEKQYFEAKKRSLGNRVISIAVSFGNLDDLNSLILLINWIKA